MSQITIYAEQLLAWLALWGLALEGLSPEQPATVCRIPSDKHAG